MMNTVLPKTFGKPQLIAPYISKSQARLFSSSPTSHVRQYRLPAAYYRGGTSRAVFFQRDHLPKDRSRWGDIFRGVIGSPDPNGRQLDGLGGGISSLSKVCVVGPSTRSDADVDYTFAALGIKDASVDYSSNCGNMTSAVGPFAVDSGLIRPDTSASEAHVRIHNTNTGKIIHETFPVVNDGHEAASTGDFSIDGVSGLAARIQMDFIDPAGSKTGKLLPTRNAVDVFHGIRTTCIDVGNPCCFVKAQDIGVPGDISPDQIESHPLLLGRLDAIRRSAGVAMGLATAPEEVPGSIPKIGMVASHVPTSGQADSDLSVRALSVGQPHKAVPITVALSLASAARLSNTVVAECVSPAKVDPRGIVLAHAGGRLMVGATLNERGDLKYATVFRTARRIMEGTVFWK